MRPSFQSRFCGANINEAQYGNSKADFIAKLHKALKETAETEYWLHILQKSEYLDDSMAASMLNDCLEIKRILISSLNTAKQKNNPRASFLRSPFKAKILSIFVGRIFVCIIFF